MSSPASSASSHSPRLHIDQSRTPTPRSQLSTTRPPNIHLPSTPSGSPGMYHPHPTIGYALRPTAQPFTPYRSPSPAFPKTPTRSPSSTQSTPYGTPYTPATSLGFASPDKSAGVRFADLPDDAPIPGEASRYVWVSGLNGDEQARDLKAAFLTYGDLKGIYVKHLSTEGVVILAFFDTAQAAACVRVLRAEPVPLLNLRLDGHFCSRQSLMGIVGEDAPLLDDGEGEVVVSVGGSGTAQGNVESAVQHALSSLGPLRSFRALGTHSKARLPYSLSSSCLALTPIPNHQVFLAEYNDTRLAALAVQSLSAQPHPLQPSHPLATLRLTLASPASRGGAAAAADELRLLEHFNRLAVFDDEEIEQPAAAKGMSGVALGAERLGGAEVGRSGPSDWRSWGRGGSMPGGMGLRRPAAEEEGEEEEEPYLDPAILHRRHSVAYTQDGRLPLLSSPAPLAPAPPPLTHSLSSPAILSPTTHTSAASSTAYTDSTLTLTLNGHPYASATLERNRIDLGRIERGEDTRTTVMIKNIPNRLNVLQLHKWIADVVPRSFDFLYLRMDFKSRSNVGYAFVNFIHVDSLYMFAKARIGEKWNVYQSEKTMQMVYANVQGKEALASKFRNSAVMDEEPLFRPQLFHSSGALVGLPEPFPEPDNPSRKARSRANQLAVGLWNTQAAAAPGLQLNPPPPAGPRAYIEARYSSGVGGRRK